MEITPDKLAAIRKNAQTVARWYARRCRWLEVADLEQQALLEQLEWAKNYNPEKGEWGSFTRTIAIRALKVYVNKLSAPVSSSKHHGDELKGLVRVELDGDQQMMHDPPVADRLVQDAQVRQRLEDILGQEGSDFAFGALVDEWRPREIAAAHDVPVRTVYRNLCQLRERLRDDGVLFDAWAGET